MANRPDFNLLVPIQKEGADGKKRTQWVRFGSVWKTENGNFSGTVDFFPAGAGNRIVLMPPKAGADTHDEDGVFQK